MDLELNVYDDIAIQEDVQGILALIVDVYDSATAAENVEPSKTTWMEGYYRRKQITITGQTGAGTNYVVKMRVGESSASTGVDFHVNSGCRSFPSAKGIGGDLRFTTTDGVSCEFWVEHITGVAPNRTAHCWVKVPLDLGTNKNIYCYYRRTAAPDYSSIIRTFVLADDFDGAVLDTTKWGWVRTPSSWNQGTTLANYLNIRGPSANIWYPEITAPFLKSKSAIASGDYELITKMRFNPAQNSLVLGILFMNDDNNLLMVDRQYNGGNWVKILKQITATPTEASLSFSATDFWIRIRKTGTTYQGWASSDLITWSSVGTMSSVTLTNLYIAITAYSLGGATIIDGLTDYVTVRKFQTSDPAFSTAGAEEAMIWDFNVFDGAYVSDAEGMLAWFKCNDNAANTIVTDAMGRNNGVAAANTNLISAAGKINNCMNVRGQATYYFDVGAASKDDPFNFTGNYTFCFWFNITNTSTFQHFFHRSSVTNGSGGGYQIALWNGTFYLTTVYTLSGTYADTTFAFTTTNTWVHLCVKRMGGKTYAYINNAEVTYTAQPISANSNSFGGTVLRVGQTVPVQWPLLGKIDDIRIFNYAINDAQRTDIYRDGYGTEDSESPVEVSRTEWFDGYNKRQKITITGQTGAGTNYVVRMKVGESAGAASYDFHVNGGCRSFPTGKNASGDLRFTTLDGISCPFWVESVTGSAPNRLAVVHVNVPYDLGTNQDIYCYYYKENSTSYSDPITTFILADDFEDGMFDYRKWTWVRTPAVWDEGQSVTGMLSAVFQGDLINTTVTAPPFRSVSALSSGDYEIVSKMAFPSARNFDHIAIMFYDTDANWFCVGRVYNSAQQALTKNTVAAATTQTTAAFSSTNFYLKLTKIGTTYTGYYSNDGLTWTQIGTGTNANIANLYVAGFAAEGTDGATLKGSIDFIRVKKLQATEPAYASVTTEEVLAHWISQVDSLTVAEYAQEAWNIATWTQLNAVKSFLSRKFELSRNLLKVDGDYSGIGGAWTAITNFTGAIDGKGFYIEGLTGANALLKTASGAILSNLGLKDVAISGGSNIGAFAMGASGFDSNWTGGSLTNCWVTGTLYGSGDWIAGIYGFGSATISKCWVNLAITSTANGSASGFIVVQATNHITDCFARGSLYCGGSVYTYTGFVNTIQGNSNITNCYSVMTLTKAQNSGSAGFIQVINVGSTVKNCYYAGSIINYGSGSGGFCYTNSGTITNCGWWNGCGATYAIYTGAGSVTYSEADRTVFYDKTHNVYDTVTPYWDFSIAMWIDHASTYPDFDRSWFEAISVTESVTMSLPLVNVFDAATAAENFTGGGLPIYFVGGFVYLGLNPVSGAKVILIREDTLAIVATGITDAFGYYSFSALDLTKQYHVVAEYTSGPNKYNARSLPYVNPSPNLQNQNRFDAMAILEDVNLTLI